MVKNIYIICLFSLMSFVEGYSQQNLSLFKNQDYSAIRALLSTDVTVKINNTDNVKGKKAGLLAIKTALTDFNPVKIESRHKGKSSKKSSDYQIAKLTNAEGEVIRLFIHFENSEKGRKICDIKLRSV